MPRTSTSEVDDIFDTSLSTSELDVAVDAANDIVDRVENANQSLASEKLARIERYLAAHFAAAQDPRQTDASGASRSTSFGEGREDEGGYFRRAVMLDPTGEVRAAMDEPDFTLSI